MKFFPPFLRAHEGMENFHWLRGSLPLRQLFFSSRAHFTFSRRLRRLKIQVAFILSCTSIPVVLSWFTCPPIFISPSSRWSDSANPLSRSPFSTQSGPRSKKDSAAMASCKIWNQDYKSLGNCPPTPSPKLKFCAKWGVSVDVGLGFLLWSA